MLLMHMFIGCRAADLEAAAESAHLWLAASIKAHQKEELGGTSAPVIVIPGRPYGTLHSLYHSCNPRACLHGYTGTFGVLTLVRAVNSLLCWAASDDHRVPI